LFSKPVFQQIITSTFVYSFPLCGITFTTTT
jgi:hypothetical protein